MSSIEELDIWQVPCSRISEEWPRNLRSEAVWCLAQLADARRN